MDSVKRILRKTAAGVAVCLLTISTSLSDDIDVYVTPGTSAAAGETFVIFTLDLRPNVLASEVCTGDDQPACEALFTDPIVNMGEALEGHTSYLELLTATLKKVLREKIVSSESGETVENDTIINPRIKVALMVPHDDTGGNKSGACLGPVGSPTCSNGAYVLSAFKSTTNDPNTIEDESQEVEEFFEKFESIPYKDGGNWGHSFQLKELFFEMYRYMTAGRVFNGRNGRDNFGTRNENTLNIDHVEDTISVHPDHIDDPNDPDYTTGHAELSWDPASQRNNELDQPFYTNTFESADQCSRAFSINFVDGTASDDGDSDAAIQEPRPAGLGITLDNSNFRSRLQVLEFLSRTDLDDTLLGEQNMRSYFIVQGSGGSGNIGGRANDWAQAGGTDTAFIATADPEQLVSILQDTFDEILGVSTTFVAASVPANVFNRAETLNEVFLAIFEPDTAQHPFWVGNVKKLTTTTIEENVDCVDTNDDGIEDECTTEERKVLVDVLEASKPNPTTSAINPTDGRIRAGALTYWTQTGTNNEYLPPPDPDNEKDQLEFTEGTDGRKVARGGAGQVKPGFLGDGSPGEANGAGETVMAGPRKLFTEPDALDGTSLVDPLVELNGASGNTVAADLLLDDRPYPGSEDNTSYGDFLFQTVMGCDTCTYQGADTTDADRETAQLRVSNLVRYARGFDLDPTSGGLDTPLSTSLAKRAWWQADPLHSRPLALNYGARPDFTNERPDIRILVAGNDGLVQMIRDGRTTDGTDEFEDGVEAWAFLPREFVPLQKRLWEGTPGDYLPGQPIAEGADPRIPLHPYAMDGGPTALVIDNNLDGTINPDSVTDDPDTPEDESLNGDDRVLVFMGQRRGGKRYYALDVSDPDDPKYLWSIGKNDPGGDFAEMGMSWSLLRAGVMRVTENTGEENTDDFNRPVLVFSGGYNGDDGGDGDGDLGKDQRVNPGVDGLFGTADDEVIVGTNDTEGNALFIVNAETGELIWKAVGPNSDSDGTTTQVFQHNELVDSVASSPTIVDSDGNGQIDRVYFPDTGGNVWRMDAGGPDRANWTVTKLFSGGRHFMANAANDRRFFNAPDVVFAKDETNFDAVILASGDRAHPLGTEAENWIYMIKDRATRSGNPSSTTLTHDDLADLTENCLQNDPENFGGCTEDPDAATNIDNGWKVQLEQCQTGDPDPKCGEKSLASPLTIEGTIFLTSFLPQLEPTDEDGDGEIDAQEICGPKEGDGLFYALDLQTAAGVLEFDPSNNAGGVEVPDRFDKLSSPGIPPEPVAISPEEVLRPDLKIQKTKGRKSARTFWYDRRFE